MVLFIFMFYVFFQEVKLLQANPKRDSQENNVKYF